MRCGRISWISSRAKESSRWSPAADRAAVEAWASLGVPKPALIFPFEARDEADRRIYFTENPAVATDDTTVAEDDAKRVGATVLPSTGEGHRAQSEDAIGKVNPIIFIVKEDGEVLEGSTRDTLALARNLGKRVIVIAHNATARCAVR